MYVRWRPIAFNCIHIQWTLEVSPTRGIIARSMIDRDRSKTPQMAIYLATDCGQRKKQTKRERGKTFSRLCKLMIPIRSNTILGL
ncbi:hypothetical protein BC936DRAFT_149105 [Jimgerdemannia flammicorona]|uniref:Uncharacterized protein n=1 Tax=Jimgerdemannia flammicorona TaxID=994334 RepID=A0A433D1J5_9FUNG|nr:hypothetical protein BC936DRAFT_149105 [Jimgerdemannia flammicorona]